MAVLPQSSSAWYVLVMSSGQVFPSDTSDMKVVVGFAVQLSVGAQLICRELGHPQCTQP